MLTALQEILEGSRAAAPEEEILSFPDYLELVKKEPWITRNTFQLMHDMLLSSGLERTIVPGKPITNRYGFFEDDALVAHYVVFGQQKAKENLVEKIDNASRGLEASKRLWILLGPPGAAKSRSMDGIKTALNIYSGSEEGKTFTLLLPSVDERLKEKALFEEDGIYYLQSPIFERPLQVLPQNLRPQFVGKLNELVEGDKLQDFLGRHPHYDGDYQIDVDGLISPFSDHVIHEFMKAKGLDFAATLPFLKVKRMVYDARTKTGIGAFSSNVRIRSNRVE